jgi:hypothetical protein
MYVKICQLQLWQSLLQSQVSSSFALTANLGTSTRVHVEETAWKMEKLATFPKSTFLLNHLFHFSYTNTRNADHLAKLLLLARDLRWELAPVHMCQAPVHVCHSTNSKWLRLQLRCSYLTTHTTSIVRPLGQLAACPVQATPLQYPPNSRQPSDDGFQTFISLTPLEPNYCPAPALGLLALNYAQRLDTHITRSQHSISP